MASISSGVEHGTLCVALQVSRRLTARVSPSAQRYPAQAHLIRPYVTLLPPALPCRDRTAPRPARALTCTALAALLGPARPGALWQPTAARLRPHTGAATPFLCGRSSVCCRCVASYPGTVTESRSFSVMDRDVNAPSAFRPRWTSTAEDHCSLNDGPPHPRHVRGAARGPECGGLPARARAHRGAPPARAYTVSRPVGKNRWRTAGAPPRADPPQECAARA